LIRSCGPKGKKGGKKRERKGRRPACRLYRGPWPRKGREKEADLQPYSVLPVLLYLSLAKKKKKKKRGALSPVVPIALAGRIGAERKKGKASSTPIKEEGKKEEGALSASSSSRHNCCGEEGALCWH